MRNWWLRFGCFLTGHNYQIVRSCSEATAKSVKRYTSALLIVCIIWAFVGYMFTHRYLQAGVWPSIAGAVIMVIIVIQVERQIILTLGRNWPLYLFRGVIAVVMAILGAVIIDQVIFKNDIELEQLSLIDERVNRILPAKSAELREQIHALDSTILHKEAERQQLLADIDKNPTIRSVTTQRVGVPLSSSRTDSLNNTVTTSRIEYSNSQTVTSIPNPKLDLVQPLDRQIEGLRDRKATLDSNLLALRPVIERDIRSKVGFLDELEVMYRLIKKSGIALTVWLLWFLFLLGLEMFVLISKTNDKRNDYEEKIENSMNIHIQKLRALSNGPTARADV